MVVVSAPDAACAFLKTLDINFSNRPSNAGATHLAYNAQDMAFIKHGPRWKLLRKLSNLHMLGGKALNDWAHVRVSELGHMLQAMHESSIQNEPVAVTEMLNYAMANMIGQVMLSKCVFATKGSESNLFKDMNMFTAGTDTSLSTTEWALAEMIKNPSILKRAHEEMDLVIGPDRRLLESDLPKLPYLQAICKETFRLHPPTPLNLPRVSTEACQVNGYHIPKNTRLSVNVWGIGRDPEIDPRGNDFELTPFGAGRRICAGTRMGIVLVEYILGTLVHSFDWRLPEGTNLNMDETFGQALRKAVPLSAMITARLPLNAYAP
ncbi:hypothetical protein RJ640_018190 [Escallonia rubra]|uniref:Flavonoid 3',5'-hydroxylase n=1 Tax=Escallonia rubra TaxID=112253 RepID=A0AA88UC58_9ASTE|nr:hypothetical protein RJ640_018190 [Escallonia rubra]